MTNEADEGSEYDQLPQVVAVTQDMMGVMKCIQNYFQVFLEANPNDKLG